MNKILVLDGVSKSYQGVPAVQDVDLHVKRGERLAVIGPNGAGKSTLFGLIAGEHRPTRGHVLFDGREVTRLYSSSRSIEGMSRTFQVARLFTSMTVRENLFIAALAGRRKDFRVWDAMAKREATWARVEEAIEMADLGAFADASASTLPQGARKTLEMAMAIIQDPTLLLLDEPTAGMGYEDARAATAQLKLLLDERPEMTLVLTAHDMDVVHTLADRVVLMSTGKVVLDGTASEIAAHPTTKTLYLGQEKKKK